MEESNINNPRKTIPTFIGIVIIVVVAIILFGGVFAYQYFATKNSQPKIVQPTTQNNQTVGPALSEVEGWKTYTNNKFKYSFKYPADWTVWEADSISGLIILYPSIKSDEVINKTILTSDEITFSILGSLGANYKGEQIKIGDLTWSSALTPDISMDGGNEKLLEYIGAAPTEYVGISTGIHNKEIVQQILSTFKFITSASQINSSLPKNYDECKNAVLQVDNESRVWPLCEYSVPINKPFYNDCVTMGGTKIPEACATCPGCKCILANCSLFYIAQDFVLPKDYDSCVNMSGGAYGGGGDSGGEYCSIDIPKPEKYNVATITGVYSDCMNRGGEIWGDSCSLKIYKK